MLGKAHGILDDLGGVEFGDEQDVPWGVVPVEGEEARGGLMVQGGDSVGQVGDVEDVAAGGRRREGSWWVARSAWLLPDS